MGSDDRIPAVVDRPVGMRRRGTTARMARPAGAILKTSGSPRVSVVKLGWSRAPIALSRWRFSARAGSPPPAPGPLTVKGTR